MRVIFIGTSSFAVPILEAIVRSDHSVESAITKPDRPAGRGLMMMVSSVKGAAMAHGLKILQPESLKDKEDKESVLGVEADIAVVAAYGKILPKWLFEALPHGAINVHGSVLPSYRGAAPIQRAIMDGQKETGVTVIQMDEGLDTGDILAVRRMEIGGEETAGELESRMAQEGADLVIGLLEKAEKEGLKGTRQPEEGSYAAKIDKEEARIDFNDPGKKIKDLVRALNPIPGAYVMIGQKRVKIWKVDTYKADTHGLPGLIAALDHTGFEVICKDGVVKLLEVQPENKKPMNAAEFGRGYRLKVGDVIQ